MGRSICCFIGWGCFLYIVSLFSAQAKIERTYQNIFFQYKTDSIHALLAQATTPGDSVRLLYHLVDLSIDTEETANLYYTLYNMGYRYRMEGVFMDALRQLTNFKKAEWVSFSKMEEDLLTVVRPCEEREGTLTFIRELKFDMSRNDKTNEQLTLLMQQYKNMTQSRANIYDRLLCLHTLCSCMTGLLYGDLYGELYERYMEEQIKLCEQLPDCNSILYTRVLVMAASFYAKRGEPAKALKYDRKLLAISRQLEANYRKEGRIFREYSLVYFTIYRRMLLCYENLNPDEVDSLYGWLEQLASKRETLYSEFYNSGSSMQLCYLMAKHRYAEALPYVDAGLHSTSSFRLSTIQLMSMRIKALEALDYKDELIKTLYTYNELIVKQVNSQADVRLRELQVLHDVQTLTDKNLQLSIENQMQQQAVRIAQLQQSAERLLYEAGISDLNRENDSLELVKNRLLISNKSLELERNQAELARSKAELKQKAVEVKANEKAINVRNQTLMVLIVILIVVSIVGYRNKLLSRKLKASKEDLGNEQKKLEKTLERVKESDHLKSAFLQNMNHEIRTPLNAIIGFTQLLTDIVYSNETKQYCDIIEANGKMLTKLIQDVLDLSALENGTIPVLMEEVYPNDISQACITSLQSIASPQVKMIFNSDLSNDFVMYSNTERIQQILTNLLMNSIKYTEQGEIRLFCKKCENDAGRVVFIVEDTGCGIPSDKVEKVFERFEKLGSLKQGVGLGLPLSRQLAYYLHGTLFVDISYVEGTRMVLTLPVGNSGMISLEE